MCGTPDFLMAEMISNFIQSISPVVKKMMDWHSCNSVCHPSQEANQPLDLTQKALRR